MSVNLIKKEIIKLSESKDWLKGKNEWRLRDIEEKITTCLCGKTISNVYVIQNSLNGNTGHICSSCVDSFLNKQMTKDKVRLQKVNCSICEKVLKDQKAYITHCKTKSHMDKKTCCTCDKKFKNKLQLFKKQYYCKTCYKNDVKKCIDCKEPFGKISELEEWRKKCVNCYYGNNKSDYMFIDSD